MTETTDKNNNKTIPFYPDHLRTEIRVVWILLGIAFLIGAFAISNPIGLEDPADPMLTPEHVKPEWYFLALYQLLKYVPKTVGVLIPIIGLLIFFIWPFFDRKTDSKKQMTLRFIGSTVFMIALIAMTIVAWIS